MSAIRLPVVRIVREQLAWLVITARGHAWLCAKIGRAHV